MKFFADMIKGCIDLRKILKSDQLEFYQSNRDFIIYTLHYPTQEESVLVSFNTSYLEQSDFLRTYKDDLKIYFQWGFYDYIRKDKVRVIFLKSNDIIVTNNFDLDVKPDSHPLYEELYHNVNQGFILFDDLIEQKSKPPHFGKEFVGIVLNIGMY